MNRLAVTGLGVWLAGGGDKWAAVDAWYEGRELPTLAEDKRVEAFRGAAARALYEVNIHTRSAFAWIGVGTLPDEAAFDGDLWVGTIWEALDRARDVCAGGGVDNVLIAEVGDVGGGALVLTSQDIAGKRPYAKIDGLGRWGSSAGVADVMSGIRQAMTEAEIGPESVTYLACLGQSFLRVGDPVIDGLLDAYRTPEHPLNCALGTVSSQIGSVLTVIKTILALNRRFLPASEGSAFPSPDGPGPETPDQWVDTPFYGVARSKPWFAEGSKRIAVAHGGGDTPESSGGHVIVSEPTQPLMSDTAMSRSEYVLVPLGAGSRKGFEERLTALESHIDAVETPADLRAVARQAYDSYCEEPDIPYVMALVGKGREGMAREIAYARDGLRKVFECGEVWQSPRGSTLTTEPLGKQGGVAFVYPGAFNAYLDLGRDLFHLFPFLYERFGGVVSNVGRSVQDRALYPRSLTPLTKKERQARQAALLADPPGLIESGTSFAVLFTTILREAFGVHPNAALGYSLGEVSMLWALGVWQDGDRGLQAWRSSPLFKTQLSGPKKLVRERWGVPERVEDDVLWATYVLKAPVARVRGAVEGRPRVEITLVNAPGEVVIGGDPEDCRAVIEALDVHALPIPYDAVIHSSLMTSLRADFASLYHYPVRAVPDTVFYSAARYDKLTLQSDALARSLAQMTCAPVDFIRLVDRVYQDGARVFVEVGSQHTCTRWIGKILDDRPHAAMAIDRKNAPDVLSILGVLAGLVSHRVPVDLSLLYQEASAPVVPFPGAVPCQEARVPVAASVTQSTAAPISSAASTLNETVGNLARDHMLRDAAIHRSFLEVRQAGMEDLSALIQAQMSAYGQFLGRSSADGRVQFDEAAVQAFASGSPTRCFGALFAPFEGRRVPRIPNGSFRFLDRVVSVDGPKGEVEVGRTLIGECDVSRDAWFLLSDGAVPYAILMEMGMQPCGFLSAYMGSTRQHPHTDFYFRNLDGKGTLLRDVDVRGRTITGRTSLRASTAVGNAIVQTFAFSLACDGSDFYVGEATFGYFTRATLDARAGLDGGEEIEPWGKGKALSSDAESWKLDAGSWILEAVSWMGKGGREGTSLGWGERKALSSKESTFFHFPLQVIDRGGKFEAGYVHAFLDVPSDAWFFARHFYEDPVMPGSLGVEAMRLALGGWLHTRLAPSQRTLPTPRTPVGRTTTWRYRGQILPEDLRDGKSLHLDVHVIDWESDEARVCARGEGSLWKGDLRIYEVKDLVVEFLLPEGRLERTESWTMRQC
jgi:PfaB family protein